MSNVIDNKIVSMEFDNSRFEKNVKTSMSTIDKLKQSLKFESSVKGLQTLDSASKRIDMSNLGKSVDAVKVRFSALEVVAKTALQNITNSAVNAGKNLVKELSVDQVTEGWSKYNDITRSTATIMSATGKSVDVVDKSLAKLNWFTDETSYNLVDMTSNIGKFTSAGVELNTAVDAMQGIALEAALSGAGINEASRAMYNFSQSMGMGSVRLQDWMSIENANMATKEFKETIIETAKELGRISKSGKILKNTASNYSGPDNVDFQNFRNTLSAGWLDNEVLTFTLKKYGAFASKLQSVMEVVDLDTTSEMLRYLDQYKKGILDLDVAADNCGISSKKLEGILKDLSSKTYELGLKAFVAGQESRTLSDALEATKDAVSTGWMNMFKIIFGNYEEAKKLWSALANDLWDIFAAPISETNSTLRGAFDSNWVQLTREIEGTGIKVSDFEKTTISIFKKINPNIDKTIKKYGSLGAAIEAGEIPAGAVAGALSKLSTELLGYNDKQLKSAGYTKEQVKEFKKLADQVNDTGSEINKLVSSVDKQSGRTLFSDTLSNSLHALMAIIDDVKEAYADIFPKKTSDDIYRALKKIDDISKDILKSIEDNSDKIQSIFKGLFASFDILKEFLSSSLSGAFKIFDHLFDGAGKKMFDFTSNLGDSIVEFRDWIKENDIFNKKIDSITDSIIKYIDKTKEFTSSIKKSIENNKLFNISIKNIGDFTDQVSEKIEKLKTMASNAVVKIKEFGSKASEVFKKVFDKIKKIGADSGISADDLLVGVGGVGFAAGIKGVIDLFDKFTTATKQATEIKGNIGDVVGNVKSLLDGLKDSFASFTNSVKISSVALIAFSIAELSSALVDLSKVNSTSITKSLIAIGDAMLILGGGYGALSKITSAGKGAKNISETKKGFGSFSKGLGSFTKTISQTNDTDMLKAGASLILIAKSLKETSEVLVELSKLPFDDMVKGLTGTAGLMFEVSKFSKSLNGIKLEPKSAFSLIVIAAALKLAGKSLVDLSNMSWSEVGRGLTAMGGALAELAGVEIALNRLIKEKPKLSATIGILILAASLKMIANAMLDFSSMSWKEIGRGLTAMGGALYELAAVFVGTTAVVNEMGKANSIISGVSMNILVKILDPLCNTMIRLSKLSWDGVGTGLASLGGALGELTGVFTIVTYVTSEMGKLNSLVGTASMDILVQVVEPLADAVLRLSKINIGDTGQSLVALGGALYELTAVFTAVSAVTNELGKLNSLVGTASMDVLVQIVEPLADAMIKLAKINIGDTGQSLAALGGALGELTGVFAAISFITNKTGKFNSAKASGAMIVLVQIVEPLADSMMRLAKLNIGDTGQSLVALGGALYELTAVFAGVSALTDALGVINVAGGSLAMNAMVNILEPLTNAMVKFGRMSWSEIGRGLTAMGVALVELTAVYAAVTAITEFIGPLGVLGVAGLKEMVSFLDPLADAMLKFGSMSWDDVKNGLAAMGGALGELALGGLLNTFSAVGANSIATMAKPLGDLADSVMKWTFVKVPSSLPTDLAKVAAGIFTFSFDGWGADAIAAVGKPLGDLARSVVAWTGVEVPSDLKDNLKATASGIRSFLFTDIGADNIAKVADPLGKLADAVVKWGSVTIPEGFGTSLKEMGDGVRAFTWDAVAAETLKLLIDPLGQLAGSVMKWKEVVMPPTLEDDLLHLANGISGFNWEVVAAGTLKLLGDGLSPVADSIQKWQNVKLPDTLEDDLLHLANGISGFNWELVAAGTIKTLAEPLGTLADSVSKWTNATDGLAVLKNLPDISNAIADMNAGDAKKKIEALVKGLSKLYDIKDISDSAISLGKNIVSNISKGIQASEIKYGSVLSDFYDKVKKYNDKYVSAGKTYISKISEGIKKNGISYGTVLYNAYKKAKDYKSNFYTAGKYCAQGFANGIRDYGYLASNAGSSIGRAAYNAAKKAIDSNSPSKKFYELGEFSILGYVNAVHDNVTKVAKAGTTMGESALTALKDSMKIANYEFLNDINVQPTIRPVVDLTDVQNKSSMISGYLNRRNASYSTSVRLSNTLGNVSASGLVVSSNSSISNKPVVDSIYDIKKEIANLKYAIENMGIYMDNGTLVGEIISGVDKKLGQIAIKKRRNI